MTSELPRLVFELSRLAPNFSKNEVIKIYS
jgi:hypothetical protein